MRWLRLREAFKRKTLGGWAVVLIGVVWSAVDHLGRIQFVVSNTPRFPDVAAWLQTGMAAVSTAVAAIWSPFTFQTVLIIAGLMWVLLANRSSAPEPEQQMRLELEAQPQAKSIDKAETARAASRVLARFLKEGDVLHQSHADTKLFVDWEMRTARFLKAAFGDEEVARFFDESDGHPRGLPELFATRLNKLIGLGRRLEFTKVLDSFNPQSWTET